LSERFILPLLRVSLYCSISVQGPTTTKYDDNGWHCSWLYSQTTKKKNRMLYVVSD